MAVTKIKPIRGTVNKAIAYILDPQKTDDDFYVSSYGCAASDAAAKEFEWTRNLAVQQGMQMPKVLARHLIQSFDIGEVTPEEAHEVGKQLADEWLKGKYEYVIATHIDKGHCHNHIIFNAVNYVDFHAYRSNKRTYRELRQLSDEICKEHGLSVIPPSQNKGMDYKVIDTSVIKGILYKGTIVDKESGLSGYGEWFAFASEKDRTWCTLILCQTDNTEYTYTDDFMKVIESIKPVEDVPPETPSTNTAGAPDDWTNLLEKHYEEVKKQFEDAGFTNITCVAHEIDYNEDNVFEGSVVNIAIGENGEICTFEKGEQWDKDIKIRIDYRVKPAEEEKPDTTKIVLPEDGSKLAIDFDSEGKSTIYYINVDGISNKPTTQTWGSATVTDGVAEYLDYLKELGVTVTITDTSHREPYSGFHVYETNFKVSNSSVSWTMYLCIQKEAYVEYELDIHKN